MKQKTVPAPNGAGTLFYISTWQRFSPYIRRSAWSSMAESQAWSGMK